MIRIYYLLVLCFLFQALNAQTTIELEKDGGVYKIPCKVNGLKLKFIFDTGASSVCISQTVAIMMLENDYLSKNDIKGSSQSQVADGRIVENTKINLRKIEIGDKVLTNVEAVVMHELSAPLLLGQSALKKLGRYSISGNKLILGMDETNNQNEEEELSEEEIDQLFEEANEFYNKELYSMALEKYELLDSYDLLSAVGKLYYADCYYHTGKREDALDIYTSIQKEIESDFPKYKVDLYYQIGRCYDFLEEYDAAIPYFEKVKYYSDPWSHVESQAMYFLSYEYSQIGNEARAQRMLDDYISEYSSYKKIKSTDCWDKKYTDLFLAELYYHRFLVTSTNREIEKYIILAAAWGFQRAKELCYEYRLSYLNKPQRYGF